MTAYAKEGLEKKLSRLLFWQQVQEYLGDEEFFSGMYLGLASAEAGDASVLIGMGVPPSQVVLSDLDADAVQAARKKFPGIAVYHEDVVVTAHRFPKKFSAVFLDYCGPATEPNMTRARLVAQYGLKPCGILGINVFIGREVDFERQLKSLVAHWKGDMNPAFRARAEFMMLEMLEVYVDPLHYIHYSTPRGKSARPMCTYIGGANWKTLGKVPITRIESSSAARDVALLVEACPETAHLLLNIPKSSLPSIRSHLTRGTYKLSSTDCTSVLLNSQSPWSIGDKRIGRYYPRRTNDGRSNN